MGKKKSITKESGHTIERIVFDLDGLIAIHPRDYTKNYITDSKPDEELVRLMQELHDQGKVIVIQSARKMRTAGGNVGIVNRIAAKGTLEWLEKYNVPFDEIHFGKPYGHRYYDDLAMNFSREDMLAELRGLLDD